MSLKIKNNPYPKGEDVGIVKMTITYRQEIDCNAPVSDDCNDITISVEDVPLDDETFQYYYTMQTERWSFNEPEEVFDLLNDFKQRLTRMNDEQRD